MHIERTVERSLNISEDIIDRVKNKDSSMKNRKTVQADAPPCDASTPRTLKNDEIFDRARNVEKYGGTIERSINDKTVYATIDRLALKRARLPLQLVPMDNDDDSTNENKDDKTNGERRLNGNRKTSPRRPSFKVRPGIPSPSSGQWKSRNPRTIPRTEKTTAKCENNITKRLASRVVVFEKIIRDNDERNCGRSNPPMSANGKVAKSTMPETERESAGGRDNNEHSKLINWPTSRADRPSQSECRRSPSISGNDKNVETNANVRKSNTAKCEKNRSITGNESARHSSISSSLPTNSKLLSNDASSESHCGNAINREIDNIAGKVVSGKMCWRNSSAGRLDDETTYVEIRKTEINFDETGSSISSGSSSDDERDVDVDVDVGDRAKVSSLEKSRRGVPEVVKTSENEGNDEHPNESRRDEEANAVAPVYESMSEFLINDRTATAGVPDGFATTRANRSFLWRGRAAATARRANDDESAQPMTNASNRQIIPIDRQTSVKTDNSIEAVGYDTYDDVGLSRDDAAEEDDYDDVGLPSTCKINCSTDTLFEDMEDGENGQLYDDVVPAAPMSDVSTSTTNPPEFGNDDNVSNVYSSVEEGLDDFARQGDDDGLYDDVELPSQERVNSLYAGSSSGSQLGSLYNGKESEWEDLDEATAAPAVSPLSKKTVVPSSRHGDSQSTTKKSVQRWSRKVRQQKSKASRKNSASRSTRDASTVSDTASDDSNYETVFSINSDEFSSDSDDDDDESSTVAPCSNVDDIYAEAPSRPVPPPPRESSLTETFGKRMKMLRRTWSITKGSLGRMRRRTSTTHDNETTATTTVDDVAKYQSFDNNQIANNDAKKYFGLKKHFKKSSVAGLSTFYLDNENPDETLSRNNNCSKEEVYSDCSNSSWYTNTDYWRNSVTEQSQRNYVDHYSMLDEEPLYQFYAAAAARVAFESDSEGYEEVEDPTPSPSAVNLARPGHRTLWCQTPQVMSSTLLQLLPPESKRMQEAKFEIFTSEASYLNSLRVLVDEFLNDHELVNQVLTTTEREKLFGGVPSVLVASERLLAEMETVWREDVMLQGLPEVLLSYARRSSTVYVAYCSNQVSIDTTLNELKNKKGSKFVETVRRIESHPACQSLSLHSFLMLPMQRVTRLPLLADAVLSKVSADNKEERTCWECVLSQLSQVVVECNEGARAAGRLAEMEALERKLEYSSKVPPIKLRDRYLVRRGPVVQMLAKPDAEYKLTFGKKHHKAHLYLLLLTDYLLIGKIKSCANEETYTVTDSCKRSLVELEKVTDDSPFAGRHAMVLTLLENYSGRHVEYILTCQNATDRERWLDAVSPPKPSLVGETLYETWDCPQVMALYPYAAAQPDELTLQPGDVINVLRKMTDGWHLGEKLMDGEQGWFPGNYAKEVASEHVRARNLRQRHRLLALSASVLQQRAKQTSRLH